MTTFERFTIEVPDAVIADLHERLDRSRLPGAIAGIGWEQGTDREYLGALLDHWRHRYDWRATEARLNEFDQLQTEIDGQRIHVLHAPSSRSDALPLLLVHGWPGSIMEFLDVIEPLRRDFHVVAPSLPGFTFSGPTSEAGWHPRRIAAAFGEVMAGLGHDRYGAQGGDWGSLVCANVADLFPDRVVGLHLNMVTAAPPIPGANISTEEQAALDASKIWRRTGIGYQEIQSTKPQSLGYGLEDSPSGLAGWMVEKFREWSDADIADAFTFDRLLDNITAYWLTGTATSSLRIYWEMRNARRDAVPRARIEVPTCVARYPGEISYPPKAWIDAAYRVVRWSSPPQGGHFAAMEAPEVFADDVRSFFETLPRDESARGP